jgi:hypothetical protein
MKAKTLLLLAALAAPAMVNAQSGSAFTNFVRQVQLPQPQGTIRDTSVVPSGSDTSALAIDPDGARFELWTILSTNPPQEFLLAEQYVGTYVPQAIVTITTSDPYLEIPRTRADQPFTVNVSLAGLLSGAGDPVASKTVDFEHHVQSYGAGGTGVGIDRTQAHLWGTTEMNQNSPTNAPFTYSFTVNQVPGADRSKVRGEERFTIMSKEDIQGANYNVPAQVLSSRFVQIWPVADGSIAGITNDQLIRFSLPNVTLTVNDAYPDSATYAQVYKGAPALGTQGTVIPGSSKVVKDTAPQNLTMVLEDYDAVFDAGGDGQWTMELLTSTPFGIDRLAYVTFNLDRTIQFNGSVTTQESN